VNCPLVRWIPKLAGKIAWRSLGGVRTPIHICRIPSLTITTSTTDDNKSHPQSELKFYLKREDLISPLYGGNKVRTLQHQLAICEARRHKGEKAFRNVVSVGTGGSNQVVAMVVHARSCGYDAVDDETTTNEDDGGEGDVFEDGGGEGEAPPRIHIFWPRGDAPDLDNTLNLLSVLSFTNPTTFKFSWGDKLGGIRNLYRALHGAWTQKEFIPMMLGGNSPAGVLGQISGILELAEQIEKGESIDPQRIYVPVGSGCTISGLIIGVVLVRHLKGGEGVLGSKDFRIVGCNVQEQMAFMDRMVGFHLHPFFSFMPLTVVHTVKVTCRALVEVGGPDILGEVLEFVKTSVELRSDAKVVGLYGAHSELTRSAARLYDEKGVVEDLVTGEEKEKLWLCGHFAGKAFQPLLVDLEAEICKMNNKINKNMGGDETAPVRSNNNTNKEDNHPKFMLWMTKSAVQPRGNADEWSKMMQENDTVKQWADEGKAESTLRPGRVSTADGTPDDYRFLMKKIV